MALTSSSDLPAKAPPNIAPAPSTPRVPFTPSLAKKSVANLGMVNLGNPKAPVANPYPPNPRSANLPTSDENISLIPPTAFFKVFLRPLQGLEVVWKEMGKSLSSKI